MKTMLSLDNKLELTSSKVLNTRIVNKKINALILSPFYFQKLRFAFIRMISDL